MQYSHAQVNLDNLRTVWNDSSKPDTIRLAAMHKIVWDGYLFSNPDSAFYFAKQQYNFAKKKGSKKHMALALKTQGVSYYLRGDYSRALSYYAKSLKIYKKIKDQEGIAACTNNSGLIYYMQADFDRALSYYTTSLRIYKELGDQKGLALSMNNIGLIYFEQGDYKPALESYAESLKIREELKDKREIAASLSNIGNIKKIQGDYYNALDFYNKALKLYKETNNKIGTANTFNNIGGVYLEQKHYDQAQHYYNRSLEINREFGNKEGESITLNNLGTIYQNKENYTYALECYKRSLAINEELADRQGKAVSLNHIGFIYDLQDYPNRALSYYKESLTIYEEIGDQLGIAKASNHISNIYIQKFKIETKSLTKKDFSNKAIFYGNKSLTLAQKIGAAITIRDASFDLCETYKLTGNSKEALKMYGIYVNFRDSILKGVNQQDLVKQEFKHDYEKKVMKDSLKMVEENKVITAELATQQAQLKRGRMVSYALYGGLGLLLLFVGFMYNRFRVIHSQKNTIEHQKEIVEKTGNELETKNREITDSIQYTKRIQGAIFASNQTIKEYLGESFAIYKPKDIVGGDFYWMELVENSSIQVENIILFAVADCAGDGVSGAMMSVVCNNALNRSVREHRLLEPGKILDKTREILFQDFEQSKETVTDGMSIALCAIEGNKLHYAGANHPLWVVRKKREGEEIHGAEVFKSVKKDVELYEIKADKQPIEKTSNPESFTLHQIDLQKGDTIYLFSDGYLNQFGGKKNKKFKELLLSIQEKSMEDQKEVIHESFETWRRGSVQMDDICMIGVKV